jgi:hypothetical protein
MTIRNVPDSFGPIAEGDDVDVDASRPEQRIAQRWPGRRPLTDDDVLRRG